MRYIVTCLTYLPTFYYPLCFLYFLEQMAARTFQRLFHWGTKVTSLAPRSQTSSWQCERVNIRKASTYRAAVLNEFGQELQIQELKRKKLEGNEVS